MVSVKPLHEDFEQLFPDLLRTPVHGGYHDKFQRILNSVLLLQCQAVIRAYELSKILLPERQCRLSVRIRHIFRQLFPVSGVEICEHFSDERRRLSPDIALAV